MKKRALTPRQENFCLAYLETGNASEAYRRAYNAGNMKPETLVVKASVLLKKDNVRIRLDELRQPIIERASLTLEQHLSDLKRIRDLAIADGQFAAAVAAETVRGKAAGLNVKKSQVEGEIRFMWAKDGDSH